MNDVDLISQTTDYVKKTLKDAEAGHDWFHTQRVFQNALLIAKEEKVDILVVSLAALLHDIADAKFQDGDETIGPKVAKDFLIKTKVAPKIGKHVVNIVKYISFKNSLDKSKPKFHSKELEVVQDADRLDAIGAIGIARAFHYGGFKNRALYDPKIAPNLNMTKKEYKNSTAPTLNHFYEKLLLLKDQMHTKTGKRMANQRHAFMLDFLKQFYAEWNGQC